MRENKIKDVAKELNFTINPNVEGQILKQFGSVESWRTKIIDFRKSKESKKMAYKENRTTTDGDNTYSLWAYDEFGFLSTFPVGADEYILDAAEAQGFDFGSCDRAGVGPTCVARLRSGLIDGYNQSYLNDCQLEAGFLLPCVSYALSDCQITFLQETELDNFNQSYSNEPCNNMGQYEMNFCSMSSTDASRWHQDMMWHLWTRILCVPPWFI